MARLDYVTFFATLSEEELGLLLECALQGVKDELNLLIGYRNEFTRDGDALEDISEDRLVDLHQRLFTFLNP